MHCKGHRSRQDPVSDHIVFDSHAPASGFVSVPDSRALRLDRAETPVRQRYHALPEFIPRP
jgi:hypothetical protein